MALPESAPPSRPPIAGAARDLSDAEFVELSELLAGVPEPLQPLSVDMADGFLAALAVQPAPIEASAWLRHVFDEEGHRWGEAEPAPEQQRAAVLLQRRLAAIESQLAEFRAFDPYLLDAPADTAAGLTTVVAVVAPWLAGFFTALDRFPLADTDADPTLDRLERYLDAAASDIPASVETAIGEILDAVAFLRDRAEQIRFHVATVRRRAAKVGRNQPCPCGSGVKFKQCHGRPDAA